jgi:hypothetical protein
MGAALGAESRDACRTGILLFAHLGLEEASTTPSSDIRARKGLAQKVAQIDPTSFSTSAHSRLSRSYATPSRLRDNVMARNPPRRTPRRPPPHPPAPVIIRPTSALRTTNGSIVTASATHGRLRPLQLLKLAEIAVASFRRSFSTANGTIHCAIASARAGMSSAERPRSGRSSNGSAPSMPVVG